MLCQPDEEEAPRNDGAGYDNAEFPRSQFDEEEEELPKQTRKRDDAEYELVKRWVTGERAVLPEEDIEHKHFEEARQLMHLSGLKNCPVIKVSTLICICGRRPAPGIKHERVCRTPFIISLCGIMIRASA